MVHKHHSIGLFHWLHPRSTRPALSFSVSAPTCLYSLGHFSMARALFELPVCSARALSFHSSWWQHLQRDGRLDPPCLGDPNTPQLCSHPKLAAGLIQGAQGQVAKEVRAGYGARSSILLPAAAPSGDLSVSLRVSPGGRGGAV